MKNDFSGCPFAVWMMIPGRWCPSDEYLRWQDRHCQWFRGYIERKNEPIYRFPEHVRTHHSVSLGLKRALWLRIIEGCNAGTSVSRHITIYRFMWKTASDCIPFTRDHRRKEWGWQGGGGEIRGGNELHVEKLANHLDLTGQVFFSVTVIKGAWSSKCCHQERLKGLLRLYMWIWGRI